jgi:periplasmic protein CpxP/Spy
MTHRQINGLLGIALGIMVLGLTSVAWADGSKGAGCRDGRASMMGHARHGMHELGMHGHGVAAHVLRHLLRDKQELGLTDEQIAKWRTIALDYDRAAIRGKAEVMVAERELRALTRDEQAELATIEAKVKEREALEATVRILGIKVKRDLMGVLTPEQRTKQKALREQMRQRHRGSMEIASSAEQTETERLAEESTGETEFSLAGVVPSAG